MTVYSLMVIGYANLRSFGEHGQNSTCSQNFVLKAHHLKPQPILSIDGNMLNHICHPTFPIYLISGKD